MNAISSKRSLMVTVAPLIVLYMRFSTTGQMDGISEDRQQEYADTWCEKTGQTINLTYIDRGASAFHETHMKGEYGRLIKDIESGKIPFGSTILVESLDRLSRADPVMASYRRTALLVAGMRIVTTIDGNVYERFGEQAVSGLFSATGHEIGNHQASKDKSGRMVKSHEARRGTLSAVMPSWIVKTRDVQAVTTVKKGKQITRTQAVTTGIDVDLEKKAIVRRLGTDLLLSMGYDSAARILNEENVPTLNGRKLGRTESVWDASMIKAIFIDRKVLGEQSIGHSEHGKRVDTGEHVKNAYHAIMTEAEYFRLHEAINARKRGSSADGRKIARVSNLFGNLARCSECQNRMTVATRGRGHHLYFTCSMAKLRKCEANKYHRLDRIEQTFCNFFAEASLSANEKPANDPAKAMQIEFDIATMEAAKLETRRNNANDELMDDRTDPIKRKDFERADGLYREKVATVKRLESAIVARRAATPAETVWKTTAELVDRLVNPTRWTVGALPEAESIALRAKIAASLPAIFKGLSFQPDGTYSMETVADLPATLPESKSGKLVRLFHQHGNRFVLTGKTFLDTKPPAKIEVPAGKGTYSRAKQTA